MKGKSHYKFSCGKRVTGKMLFTQFLDPEFTVIKFICHG